MEPATITVYSPESPLRHPVAFIREAAAQIWSSRELVVILFTRDLAAAYRQSYFRYLWIVLPSILSTCLWYFLVSQQIFRVAQTNIPYPVYVLTGQIFWTTFTSAFSTPMEAFNGGSSVFMKLKVPPEAFIAAGLAKAIFEILVRLLLLIPVFILYGITPPLTAVLLPVALFGLVVTGMALGLILVPFGSLYHDVTRAASMFLPLLMYTTPTIFPPPTSGFAAKVIALNPLTPLIAGARDWLTVGPSAYGSAILLTIPIALIVLAVGVILLRVALPHLIARMGM